MKFQFLNYQYWAIFFLLTCIPFNRGYSQCKLDYSNYDPVFVDEFNTYTNPFFLNNPKWVLGNPCEAQGAEKSYFAESQVAVLYDPNLQSQGMDGHILRLTAQKLTVPIMCGTNALSWKSGKIETKETYTPLDNNSHASWTYGWAYGIFEIKCKLPANVTYDVWPAFWLYSGATEIDLIDDTGADPDHLLQSGMIDWGHYPDHKPWHWTNIPCGGGESTYNPFQPYNTGNKVYYFCDNSNPNNNCDTYDCYQAVHDIPQTACSRSAEKIGGADLSSVYHVYSVVWTPNEVTFFLNGREINTIPSSLIVTTNFPAKLIAELQMYVGENSSSTHYMDIDWIKVWKPKGYVMGSHPNTFTNYNYEYYQSPDEYMNHNINKEALFTPPAYNNVGVHPEKGSIAFNPNNSNEVFYRGTDNRIYKATYIGNYWSVERLEYNGSVPMPDALVGGALNYHPQHGIITYVGQDGRI